MSFLYIPTRFQWRMDTAANWAANNPIPLQGEPCLETDTGYFKIGDGTTDYASLTYASNPAASVPITDAGGFFTGTDVDAALQELGAAVGDTFDPSTSSQFFDDFLGKPPTSTGGTAASWVLATLGTGASVTAINAGSRHPGCWRINSGTSTSGQTAINLGTVNNITLGAGVITRDFCFRLPTLSDATNTYSINIGLRDSWFSGGAERLYMQYSHATNGGAAVLRAMVGGVEVAANGSTVLAANAFYKGRIITNAAGTTAELWLGAEGADLALEASLASGLPTGPMVDGFGIINTAGSGSSRQLDIDFYRADIAFTAVR